MSTPQSSPRITPFLWFNANAAEAVDFYISVFPNSRRTGAFAPDGANMVIPFELDGRPILAFNGGPAHTFNESFSLVVHCDTQQEIDAYWTRLSEGGNEIACGWLKDRFGLCWQIIPANIAQLISHPKAMQAMMSMKKLNIADLEQAAKS